MARLVFFDTGPLGQACNLRATEGQEAYQLRVWLKEALENRIRVIIPATADYEVRRELIRAGSVESIAELDQIESGTHPLFPGVIYLPLTDDAIKRAARLWADARNRGYSTAQDKALDGDVLVVAQALEYAGPTGRFTIVTGNVRDLTWFVGNQRARRWDAIIL